ncbi:MAG: penicillin acylase family protein [Balneolaceae bacterium]
MMANKVSLMITAGLTLLLIYIYSFSIGQLPPVGSFFHPIQGFWANAETSQTNGDIDLQIDGLFEPVDIFFDERSVPHIFAQNDHDLYFAQGYITARDRLFQLEIQIRAAGGTLSEWMGSRTIEYDRSQRRLGMIYGAERAMEAISENREVFNAINAYSDGVNAYISSLDYENYPVEYKILNAEPEEWKPGNSALLLKYMTQMLAGRSDDIRTSNTIATFGKEFVDRYLSRPASLIDPIIPPETEWEFETDIPEKPNELYQPSFTSEIEMWQPDPHNGSNNWVVSGEKTAGGYPILSNDMHLNMTAPAIWYEVQLRTPDSNVYGVSLQGTPTVIVGFNEHIAWGSTNTGADVMDWFEITFRDDEKTQYLYDGEWLPVEERFETIHVKGMDSITERLLFTHHGPIYTVEDRETGIPQYRKNLALRWIAHEPSNELLTFYKLNRAQNYNDFRDTFQSYQAPAQNMNFADINGDIAIQTGGLFPVKWQYQGRTVGDGSDSRYDWDDYVPYDQNPFSLNPDRGYLSAANQDPVDQAYPYYLGDDFAPYERGRRINDLLSEMNNITVEDLRQMFMDSFSYHAYTLLPVLLERIDRNELNTTEIRLLSQLEGWEYENHGDLIEPSVFHTWWIELNRAIWDNKYGTDYPMRRPSRDRTVELILNEPHSRLFNNREDEQIETLDDLILYSYKESIKSLHNRAGEVGDSWKWGYINNTNLNHVGQIPGMGVRDIFTNGGAESINAIRGGHGPSWRMIVELDPEGVRGYGVYPGGQSGNPGSKTYMEFIETWRTGELYELLFLRSKPESRDPFPLTIRME